MSQIDPGRLTRTLMRQMERLHADVHEVSPPATPTLGGEPVAAWQWEMAQAEWPSLAYCWYGADAPAWSGIRFGQASVQPLGPAGAPVFVFGHSDHGESLSVLIDDAKVFDAEVYATPPGGEAVEICVDLREFFQRLNVQLAPHRPLSGVDLIAAPGREPTLAGLQLDGLKIDGGTLRGFRFEDTDLGHASMRDLVIEEVTMSGGGAIGATFAGCRLTNVDITNTRLDGADLTEAHLWEVKLDGAILIDADLSEANLRDVTISGGDASGLSARRGRWSQTTLEGAILKDASLAGSSLSDVECKSSDLRGVDLSGATLEGVVFEGCDLRGACLRDALGSNVVFVECRLDDMDQSGANLEANMFVRCTPDLGAVATPDAPAPARPQAEDLAPTQRMEPVSGPASPPGPAPPPPRAPAPTPAPPRPAPPTSAQEPEVAPVVIPAPRASGKAPPSPIVCALVGFFIPGAGHFMMGDKKLGIILLLVGVFTGCLFGLVNLTSAVLAFIHASRLAEEAEAQS